MTITIKLMTDEQVLALIPAMIDAGRSPYACAREIGIGLKRLRRLASSEQMEALLANKEVQLKKSRAPLPRKKGLENQEGLRAAVDDAIKRGLNISATFQELEITHYTLMKNITQEQEQALRANRKATTRPKDVFDEDDLKPTSNSEVSKKPSTQAVMREIIATHPQLGGRL